MHLKQPQPSWICITLKIPRQGLVENLRCAYSYKGKLFLYLLVLSAIALHFCILNLHILQFMYVLYMCVFVIYPYHFGLQLLRTMLLLQYLIHVLEGDLLPRNRAYKGKLFLFLLNFLMYPCNFQSRSLINIMLLMQKTWTGPF